MMLLPKKLEKVFLYLASAVYLIWCIIAIPRMSPDERTFTATICSIFFLLYLLPITILGAKISVTQSGLEVEQYVQTVISFNEVLNCYSVLLFPFRIVIVITKRPFPEKVLISGDGKQGELKTLLRSGPLANAIKTKTRSDMSTI